MSTFPLALVTGSAHRLGRVLALTLARQGYAILLHYNTSGKAAQQTAQEITALNVPVELVQADLREQKSIQRMFTIADRFRHPLSVLINSAAVMPRGDIRSLSPQEWDAAFALNLRAPFLCAQQAARRMRKGLIVNITDVGARKVWTGFPAYAISKSALESLTRILARALAPDIRVNAIAPGLVLPPDDFNQKEWNRLVRRVPMRRPAETSEISAALEFIIKNEYITGQTIIVDGGFSLV